VLSGTVAANFAGPAIVLSFVLAGTGCLFAGLCYAEFASLIPIAGSAYTYAYTTLGEIVAWIIGWDLILEYAFGAATVAAGWSGNLNALLQSWNVHIPPQLTATPGALVVFFDGRWSPLATAGPALAEAGIDPGSLPHARGILDLPACLVIAIITAILVIGVRESANFNSGIVFVKVGTVITFIAVVAAFLLRHPGVSTANWHPFIPPNLGAFGQFGWSGIARGAGVIFFAYIGFDAVSTAAQEAKNPQRDMPIGILGSLAICTALYLALGWMLTGVVNYKQLNTAAPVAMGIQATGVRWGSLVVMLGTFAGLTTTMLVMLLGQSRVFYAMSGRTRPSEISHSVDFFDYRWPRRCAICECAADQRFEPAHFHRHAACFRDRFRRRLDFAGAQAGFAAGVQNAARSGGAHLGDGNPAAVDAEPSGEHLAAADCVADSWDGALFRVRANA